MAAAGLAVLSLGVRPIADAVANIVRHRTEHASAVALSADQVTIARIRANAEVAIARIHRQGQLDELRARSSDIRCRLEHLERILEACDRHLGADGPVALATVFAEIGFVPIVQPSELESAALAENRSDRQHLPRHR